MHTKLRFPPIRAERVARPRLIARLDEALALGHRLMLVSAPAGFGKTTLLTDWAHSLLHRRPSAARVAWLSLDSGDNDVARFVAYLVGAVEATGTTGEDLHAFVETAPAEVMLTQVINRVGALPAPFVLVLDDYHVITSEAVHDAALFLLNHAPANVHIAIATRADPPLPVARWRGRGQLTELRLADLRFTPAEAADFLNRAMGLPLTDDDVAALEERTEGWIAGLQMAAVALRMAHPGSGDAAQFIRAFTGSHRFILDYLMEEVLERQSAPIQAFLLRTSILDQMCASLCATVLAGADRGGGDGTGERRPDLAELDPASILEHLDRANLFVVPLDEHREWYRYHRLFADLLRSRLEQTQPDLVPRLHQRASEWYEQNDLLNDAIDHALAAGDVERAADLIALVAEPLLMRGESATFVSWMADLPDAAIRARPSLSVLHAWVLMLQGHPLADIESRLRAADGCAGATAGRAAAVRSTIRAFQGDPDGAMQWAQRALDQLPPDERLARSYVEWVLATVRLASDGPEKEQSAFDDVLTLSRRVGNVMLSVLVLCNQAEILLREGCLRAAAATYREALAAATNARQERIAIAGQALVGLGDIAREWGDLDEAIDLITEGARLVEQWSETGAFDAYIALARVRRAQGDHAGAWEALTQAERIAVSFDLSELDDLTVAMFKALQWIAEGNLDTARRWAESRDLYRHIGAPYQESAGAPYESRILKYELLVLARLLIAQDHANDALAVLKALAPVAGWRRRTGLLIEIHLLMALARQAQDDINGALLELERALVLGEPEGYLRIFVDQGAAIVELLREAERRGLAVAYVQKLLATCENRHMDEAGQPPTSPTHPQQAPVPLAEPLSEREFEVLRMLDTHLSSTEIAKALYISPNTVRFHIKNIYGKLDVHRRSDAVDRARSLGLL